MSTPSVRATMFTRVRPRESGARSGRWTLVLEAARLCGRRGIRRRVDLAEREGLGVWPLAAQELQPRNRLLDAGAMPTWHPPQHEDHLADLLEPLAAAAQDVSMGAAVHELAQRVGVLPHRHVDKHILVLEGADRRRIALGGLQPPYEAG